MRNIKLSERRIDNIITESINRILKENKNKIDVTDLTFISYGTDKFDINKVKPINIGSEWSRVANKPEGGLWGSPVGSKFGWADFCNRESFRLRTLNKHFLFKVKKSAKICIIDNLEDLKKHIYFDIEIGKYILDIYKLVNSYDGIYLTNNGAITLSNIPYKLNISDLQTWDVESICIFNPRVVEPVIEDAFEKAQHHKYEKTLFEPDDEMYDWDDLESRKHLQIDADFERYGNRNLEDTSKLFKGEHPGLAAQKHGNSKDAKLARRFNGTIKSGM